MRLEPSPRARLAAGVCGAVAAMTARSPAALTFVLVLIGSGTVVTRTPPHDVARLWWRMLLLLGVAFVGGAAGDGSRGLVLPFFGVIVTSRGLLNGVMCAMRLALAMASVRVFLLLNDAGSVAKAVEWWLRPLRRFGADPHRIGQGFGLMIEVLPTLGREAGAAVRQAALRPRALGPALAEIVRQTTETQLTREALSLSGSAGPYSRQAGLAVVALGALSVAASLLGV